MADQKLFLTLSSWIEESQAENFSPGRASKPIHFRVMSWYYSAERMTSEQCGIAVIDTWEEKDQVRLP